MSISRVGSFFSWFFGGQIQFGFTQSPRMARHISALFNFFDAESDMRISLLLQKIRQGYPDFNECCLQSRSLEHGQLLFMSDVDCLFRIGWDTQSKSE